MSGSSRSSAQSDPAWTISFSDRKEGLGSNTKGEPSFYSSRNKKLKRGRGLISVFSAGSPRPLRLGGENRSKILSTETQSWQRWRRGFQTRTLPESGANLRLAAGGER